MSEEVRSPTIVPGQDQVPKPLLTLGKIQPEELAYFIALFGKQGLRSLIEAAGEESELEGWRQAFRSLLEDQYDFADNIHGQAEWMAAGQAPVNKVRLALDSHKEVIDRVDVNGFLIGLGFKPRWKSTQLRPNDGERRRCRYDTGGWLLIPNGSPTGMFTLVPLQPAVDQQTTASTQTERYERGDILKVWPGEQMNRPKWFRPAPKWVLHLKPNNGAAWPLGVHAMINAPELNIHTPWEEYLFPKGREVEPA